MLAFSASYEYPYVMGLRPLYIFCTLLVRGSTLDVTIILTSIVDPRAVKVKKKTAFLSASFRADTVDNN